jgi:hypothetical protein
VRHRSATNIQRKGRQAFIKSSLEKDASGIEFGFKIIETITPRVAPESDQRVRLAAQGLGKQPMTPQS